MFPPEQESSRSLWLRLPCGKIHPHANQSFSIFPVPHLQNGDSNSNPKVLVRSKGGYAWKMPYTCSVLGIHFSRCSCFIIIIINFIIIGFFFFLFDTYSNGI